MTPMMPSFSDFGDRRGDATSAEFLARINQEMYAARVGSVAPPLTSQDGPLGMMIGLARETLDLRRFVLLADLAAGGSASAQAIGYDFGQAKARAGADTITVYDPFGVTGGAQVGETGEYGFASWQEDAGRWEVVSMTTANAFDDFFIAYIDSRTLVSTVNVYGWTEYEVTATSTLPTAKSGGRVGTSAAWPAVELNNRAVPVGSLVWMKRVFKSQATASFVRTTAGNNFGQPAVFRLYVNGAVGGTYTITWGSSTTAAIAYNANAATVKTAIETAVSGLTLNSFTGAGTLADPWVVSASSTSGDVDGYANGDSLKDGSGYAFAGPGADWNWTATKSADYDPVAGEAVPINYDAANRTIRLPVVALKNDRIMLVPLYSSGGFRVILSGLLADGATGYNLNGVSATGNNLGTGYGTGEGAYIFIYSGDATVGWVCERPLA